MADILETVGNTSVKVEYDDPYSGSPFFSGDSLSAKIEKSPTVILYQEESHSSKDAESESISMESSVHELPEMTTSSDFPSEEHPAAHDSDEPTKHMEDELCYENVSANNLQIKEAKTPSPQTSFEIYQGKDISPESTRNNFEDLDSAIYDAPWDLGALQKGLEEKFKMNKQCSQDDPNVFETQTAAISNPPLDSSSTLSAVPPALAYKSKNSPELLAKFSKQGPNLQQSTKGRSPSRKTEQILDLNDPRQALQKRPLPAFPTPQSTPVSSLNFPSGSLASSSTNDRQHFQHPLQRKGVPAMGGGSVGRGHQSRPPMARNSPDWRPLEDYDSPWDNRQKDLMSTFSQEPSSLRGSMKIVVPHQYSSLVERIESRLPLEHEWWYHGPITRQDAEKRLKNEREGSYLIRNSESNRLDYSLSIKSSTGCIHLKIVPNAEGRFILGQFSQPFCSVAQMIQHYTVNKLPIKGAEHMSLTFPVGH